MSTRRLIGYVRVSTRQQEQEGLSVDAQESRLRSWAEGQGAELVRVEIDAAKSGGSLRRPALKRALAGLEAGDANGIVVVKLDRLTRSLRDLSYLLDTYFGPDKDYALASVTDSVDTSTASGRMLVNLLCTVAQWEREVVAERNAEIREYKRARGEHVGGKAPFGFRIERPEEGKPILVPEPDEQKTIARAVELRRAGSSYREIAEILTQERRMRRRNNQGRRASNWTPQAVFYLIKGQPST